MLKIEYRCYDYYYGDNSGRSSIEGYVYKCTFGEEVMYNGCYAKDDVGIEKLASPSDVEHLLVIAIKEWYEIELKNIQLVCQEDFAKKIGFDKFPWAESSWGSRDVYEEWVNKKTS